MAVLLCKDANCIFFVSGKRRILRGRIRRWVSAGETGRYLPGERRLASGENEEEGEGQAEGEQGVGKDEWKDAEGGKKGVTGWHTGGNKVLETVLERGGLGRGWRGVGGGGVNGLIVCVLGRREFVNS